MEVGPLSSKGKGDRGSVAQLADEQHVQFGVVVGGLVLHKLSETLYQHGVNWTDPAVIHAYVARYFVHPDPKVYEPLADVLVRVTLSPDYPRWAWAAALTFQMIYQQPVRPDTT